MAYPAGPHAVLKRMLTSITLILITVWLGNMAMVGLGQHRLVYFPDRIWTETPADHNLPYEDVPLHSGDGTKLHGWFVPSPGRSDSVVLFLHGNAGNVSSFITFLDVFHRLGLASLAVDYRGYGKSEGKPDEEGLYADALAGWHYLTQDRGYRPDQIILVGYSLCGAVAASLLRHISPPMTLVILSSFTSVYDMGRWRFPWLPISWIQQIYFPAEEFLAGYDGPLLFMHGTEDAIVPFTLGRKLFSQTPSPEKEFIDLPTGGHNVYLDKPAWFRRHLHAYLQRRFPQVLPSTNAEDFPPAGE